MVKAEKNKKFNIVFRTSASPFFICSLVLHLSLRHSQLVSHYFGGLFKPTLMLAVTPISLTKL